MLQLLDVGVIAVQDHAGSKSAKSLFQTSAWQLCIWQLYILFAEL